ncbi:cytochrome ubiquinol oxidase subunit I [Streptomyces sp. ISL-99]|uniref:cytochrome ubiquinol oxidase subunit I n=1 Tax=Streptomyces sp. ISL-99 TaxID=2819193 RepID=UPI0027E49DC4|nr:cytochrome ubiquinol oxidase subunit I [Streptomyces sp. ISL-99]
MEPETLDLARLQFALTAGGHFLFVALTLGLATVVAVIQTRAVFSGDPVHARMVRFWGQLYVINYAVGIVTGIVMEFQFGMAWSGLGHYAGNVFGASLAIETIVAFFVESTFLGLWIFGWNRFGKRVHLALLWVLTLICAPPTVRPKWRGCRRTWRRSSGPVTICRPRRGPGPARS